MAQMNEQKRLELETTEWVKQAAMNEATYWSWRIDQAKADAELSKLRLRIEERKTAQSSLQIEELEQTA